VVDLAAMALRSKRNDAQTSEDPLQPDLPPEEEMPDKPVELGGRGWWGTLKRTVREFQEDNLTDWAAALTYYGILSIFPGIIVLLSVFSLVSDEDTAKRAVDEVAPDKYAGTINDFIGNLQSAQGKAGLLAVVGVLGALWSASGYVAAFMRASNAIYDVPEGRPIWKTLPTRLGVTIVVGVLLVISAFIVVFTGGVAERIGDLVGLGKGAVLVWDIMKWPVLVAMVSLMFAILYWASPNPSTEASAGSRRAASSRRSCGSSRRPRSPSTWPTSASTTRRTGCWAASSRSSSGCGSRTSRYSWALSSTRSWSAGEPSRRVIPSTRSRSWSCAIPGR